MNIKLFLTTKKKNKHKIQIQVQMMKKIGAFLVKFSSKLLEFSKSLNH